MIQPCPWMATVDDDDLTPLPAEENNTGILAQVYIDLPHSVSPIV